MRLITPKDMSRKNSRTTKSKYRYDGSLPYAHKSTSKERDAETGLDYFARYYSGAQGRFTAVDPSMKSWLFHNPQSWNRYAYSLNNPLRYIDTNGKWPTDIHNQIINKAFPGLSVQQRQVLMDASRYVDRWRNQTKAHSHDHAMRSPGEDPGKAKAAVDGIIQNHEKAAQRVQGETLEHASSINKSAMNEFGKALHTVEDRTSPAHTDATGNPREWNGIPTTPSEVKDSQKHGDEEEVITPEELTDSVKAARDAFKETFGDKALQEAIKEKPID
jgi:RHS repeat-associated protein